MDILIPHIRETNKEAIANQFCVLFNHKAFIKWSDILSLTHSCSLTCGPLAATVTTGSPSLVRKLSKRATSGGALKYHDTFIIWNFPFRHFTSIGPRGENCSFKILVKWIVEFPQAYGESCASSSGQWLLVLPFLGQHF